MPFDADEPEMGQPTLRECPAELNEAEQIKVDLAWVRMGGWLSEEALARLDRYQEEDHG